MPILIHPRAQFEKQAAVPSGCRVITAHKLTLLCDALRKLAAELAADDTFRDPDWVSRLLTLWVPRISSMSCDQAIFVYHATDSRVPSDMVRLKVDGFG